jgi:hypothetical protein
MFNVRCDIRHVPKRLVDGNVCQHCSCSNELGVQQHTLLSAYFHCCSVWEQHRQRCVIFSCLGFLLIRQALDHVPPQVRREEVCKNLMNVMCDRNEDQVIRPFVLEWRLAADCFLHFLQYELTLLEDFPLQTRFNTWLQHNSDLPQSGLQVTQSLHRCYGNSWIGREGPHARLCTAFSLSLPDCIVRDFPDICVSDKSKIFPLIKRFSITRRALCCVIFLMLCSYMYIHTK